MESRRNGPQLSSRHDDDDDGTLQPAYWDAHAQENAYGMLGILFSIAEIQPPLRRSSVQFSSSGLSASLQ